jgi:uncharacterized protein (TIGR03083 family)
MLHQPAPVLVVDLFPEERAELLGLLAGLTPEEWHAPTMCAGWSVKDVVAHLLGVELGKLSRGRDGFPGIKPDPDEELGMFLDRINNQWVDALRRLSPAVLCDLLRTSGPGLSEYFSSLDLFETGVAVAWAGPEPVPVWLDVAREYTERWHHQQHIREAVGADLLNDPRFISPAMATFVRALPYTFRGADAPEGAAVQVQIDGPGGNAWAVVREGPDWRLYAGTADDPAARVSLDQDVAWRLFTNGLPGHTAAHHVQIEGDHQLATYFLRATAIIV